MVVFDKRPYILPYPLGNVIESFQHAHINGLRTTRPRIKKTRAPVIISVGENLEQVNGTPANSCLSMSRFCFVSLLVAFNEPLDGRRRAFHATQTALSVQFIFIHSMSLKRISCAGCGWEREQLPAYIRARRTCWKFFRYLFPTQ